MSRDYFVNGETMVSVKGRSDLPNISSLTQLGLTDRNGIVRITFNPRWGDIPVDAWGEGVPETQFFLEDVYVSMTLVHIDRSVLDTVMIESIAGGGAIPGGSNATNPGTFPRAGSRMGNNTPRFSPNGTLNPATNAVTTGNHFLGLNLTSPVGNKPWRFFYAYLAERPVEIPLGTEKSLFQLNWRVVPYTQDPWGGGTGAQGFVLWDYNNDT